MRLTNVSGFPASWTMGFQRDGREMLVVIVKGTYTLPRDTSEPQEAPVQVPLVEADVFTGEPGLSAPLYETDFAHRKPGCDVLIIGSAYAPEGRRVTRTTVAVKVGTMVKRFTVVGRRVWQKGATGLRPSSPEPFESLRLTYDCAFGGTDRTHEADGRTETYLANPVGLGFWKYHDRVDGQPLPLTEAVDAPIDKPDGGYIPMAFSPVGRNWTPRARLAGTYNQHWIENTAPLWPDDFDERYFQAAATDQVVPYLQGEEEVVLQNLTPDSRRAFRVPGRRMPMTFIPHRGRDASRDAVLDTLVIEPDLERFTLTWRVALPLGRSVFDVKETIVGEMPAAWHRARRFPGKTYYPSLSDLVDARRAPRGE